MAESEELKSILIKMKEESEKLAKTQHSENEDHGIWSHQTSFFWTPKSLQMVTAAMKLKDAYSLEGKL